MRAGNKRICIIRGDGLGDSLLCLPALSNLRKAYPDSEYLVYASPLGAPVFKGWNGVKVLESEFVSGQVERELREWGADVVLILTEKTYAYRLAWASKAPRRVGFSQGRSKPLKSLWLSWVLTDCFKYASSDVGNPKVGWLHEVERYQRLVELLGVPYSEPEPIVLDVGDKHRHKVRDWLRKNELYEPPICIQMTEKWCTKGGIPLSGLERLILELPWPKVGCCAPSERKWAGVVAGRCSLPLACFEDFFDYSALLEACSLLISVDTGAVHVAAAVGTPVIDVFGAGAEDIRRWRPWKVPCRCLKVECNDTSRFDLERLLRWSGDLSWVVEWGDRFERKMRPVIE